MAEKLEKNRRRVGRPTVPARSPNASVPQKDACAQTVTPAPSALDLSQVIAQASLVQ